MTGISEERLFEIIETALNNRSRIDCKQHNEHHQFIAEFIETQRMRRERWESIKQQVLGWGIIALAGSIGSYIARKFGVVL